MNLSARLKDSQSIVKALETKREREDARWRVIAEHVLPYRGFWPADSDTQDAILERGKRNINPAATSSLERSAAGMTVGMTPEGMPWVNLKTRDDSRMEASGVREHLGFRENMIYALLRSAGFYQAIFDCNLELFGFGGGLLFMDNDPKRMARFEACTVGTYCVSHDASGDLSIVVRRTRKTLKAVADKYGEDKLSKGAKAKLIIAPYSDIDIIHIVSPREGRERGKLDAMQMPWRSVVYEDNLDNRGEDGPVDVLEESGYHEMPYFYAPYAMTGASDYGIGPGFFLIGHSRQLNETERQKLVALLKMINPPTKKPAGLTQRLNVGPGQENAVSMSDSNGLGSLYEINIPLQYVYQEIKEIELRVTAVAKSDLFYDLPAEMRPNDMTATEYMERQRRRIQQVAPVVSLYEPRILDKVVERANNMLDRAGLFPPPPPALLESGGLEIEYTSTVSKSIRQAGAENTRAYVAEIGNLAKIQLEAGMKPTALLKIDIPQAADEIASGLGVPARVVVDDEKFEADLQAQLEQERQAQQMAVEKEAMESAAKLGNVRTEGTVAGQAMESGNG
jgi:hypothetical protein